MFKKSFQLLMSFVFAFVTSCPAWADINPTLEQSLDKNYLINGGFENGATGWKAYKNTAQALPVNGTGGAPTSTITSSTSSPIAGKSSGVYTHPASNTQGEGFSYSFKVDPAAQARVLTISGQYQIIAGTYSGGSSSTDSDVEVYLYDVDASQIIQPSAYKLDGGVSGLIYDINATFQTSIASTNYRLIFHNATATTSSFQIKLDNLSVTKKVSARGTLRGPVGSIISTGSTTPPTGYLFMDGSAVSRSTYAQLFAAIGATFGAGDGSTTFNLPNAQGIFLRGAGSQTIGGIGYTGTLGTSQADQFQGHFHGYGATGVNSIGSASSPASQAGLYYGNNNGGNVQFSGLPLTDGGDGTPRYGTETRPANLTVAYHICYDAGSVALSDQGDPRVVGFSSSGSSTTTTANTVTTIVPSTVSTDTHSGYQGAGFWRVPVSGYYDIAASITANAANWSASSRIILFLQYGGTSSDVARQTIVVNGSQITSASGSIKSVYLTAGQQINVAVLGEQAVTFASFYFSISRQAGPNQIAASDSVNASYYQSISQSISANATNVVVNFDSKIYDSTNSVATGSGWKFTAPSPGKYRISFKIITGNDLWASSDSFVANIFKNGASTLASNELQTAKLTGTFRLTAGDTTTLQMVTGDYFDIRVTKNGGTTSALFNNAGVYMSVERVGN